MKKLLIAVLLLTFSTMALSMTVEEVKDCDNMDKVAEQISEMMNEFELYTCFDHPEMATLLDATNGAILTSDSCDEFQSHIDNIYTTFLNLLTIASSSEDCEIWD